MSERNGAHIDTVGIGLQAIKDIQWGAIGGGFLCE
jgi:hypothetical protein